MDQTNVRELTSIKDIARHPRAVELIAEAKGRATKEMSGEELLKFADNLIPGVQLGGNIGQALYSRMGLKAESAQSARVAAPYGHAVLALLCALGRANMEIAEIGEEQPGVCAIHVKTPSNIWAFGGDAFFTVTADGEGCVLEARTVTSGQVFDFGKGKRTLAGLIDDVGARTRTYATLDV